MEVKTDVVGEGFRLRGQRALLGNILSALGRFTPMSPFL